jgi:calcium-dependent protein kinase
MFPDALHGRAAGIRKGTSAADGTQRGIRKNTSQKQARPSLHALVANQLAQQPGGLALMKRYRRAPKDLLERDYVLTNTVLGVGVSGGVRLAKSRSSNGQFAVKSFDLQKSSKSRSLLNDIATELEIMLTLDHPHIVRLLEVYETASEVHLVMEYAEGGELFDRVVEKGNFCEGDAAETARQMLTALAYLHGQKVVHRDVKPENFLYETRRGSHLKLTDFGHSQRWNGIGPMTEKRGTLAYSAPEVSQKSYTSKVDIWSVGVITFILLTGRPPFNNSNQVFHTDNGNQDACVDFEELVWNESSHEVVSADGVDFVKSLLQVDMAQRLSAQVALQHHWITNQSQPPPLPSIHLNVLRSLCNFQAVSNLRRSCLTTLARSMTHRDISNDVRNYFLRTDASFCGKIEAWRVVEHIALSGTPQTQEVKHLLESVSIMDAFSYSDFLAALVEEPEEIHLHAAFRCFDETRLINDGCDQQVSLEKFSQTVRGSSGVSKETPPGMALQTSVAPDKKQRRALDSMKRWWFSLTAHLIKPTNAAEGLAYQEQAFGFKTGLLNGCPIPPAIFNA